jgi:hypothetical protein
VRAAAAVPLLLLVAGPGRAAAAPGEEKPFPVAKTVILREEKAVYTVEGRVRIPKGVNITCQKDVHIKGRGGSTAVIEVEGTLELQGVNAREVILEGVAIEPCERFTEINADSAIFRGGGGIRTPKDKAVDGKIFVELCTFQTGALLNVSLSGGSLDLSSSQFHDPVTVRGVDPPGAKGNRVRLFARGCTGTYGFGGGLVVENVADVVIQFSRLGGGLTAVRDWGGPMRFDGNKVNSAALEFTHSQPGRMPRATVVKCDIYSDRVKARSPASSSVRDALLLDRCWFKGGSDPKVIAEKVLKDGSADAENGAILVLGKVNERPNELAGSEDR